MQSDEFQGWVRQRGGPIVVMLRDTPWFAGMGALASRHSGWAGSGPAATGAVRRWRGALGRPMWTQRAWVRYGPSHAAAPLAT